MPLDLLAIAHRQHGMFTRAQAVAAGFSHDQIRLRLRENVWREVQPGVLASASVPDRAELVEAAALLASGPRAALSGASAAFHWRLPGFADRPAAPEVVVPAGTQLRRLRVGRRRRTTAAVVERAVRRGGLRLVSLEDCICDVAALLPRRDLEALVTQVVRHERRTTADRLLAVCRHGRAGSAALRRAVQACSDRARSVWERHLARLLTAAGLPPVLDHRVVDVRGRVHYLDLCYPDVRLAIEVDGWSTHGDRASFGSDRRRKRRLVLGEGWYVVEVTPEDIRDRPDELVEMIRAFVLQKRSAGAHSSQRTG